MNLEQESSRPSWLGWAILLSALVVAGLLRFWQLDQLPPGLYRDEAVNGLDALEVLSGDRQGEPLFYFSANNGREPLYIYLTSLPVYLLGNTALAVRLAAAFAGTVTTLLVYQLSRSWFDHRTGLLSAWLWAVTVWPLHLSRIGLRPILLPLIMTSCLILATEAYRGRWSGKANNWLWVIAGFVYGLSFYTYLAVRFTPLLIILIIIFLYWRGRAKPLWPGLAFALIGTLVALTPLLITTFQEPDLVLGRVGQVSIFSESVNNGAFWSTLNRSGLATLGMFVIEGDTIVRHNPPGRPVFDILMVVPFLIGLLWCLRGWRRPAAAITLLWIVVMLLPTILAEDAPHFLRAAGVLPAAVFLPAIGLSQIWSWSKLPSRLGLALVVLLTIASFSLMVNDYFLKYSRSETTGYWFESAARQLAESLNREGGKALLDQRYLEGWPSIRYLLNQKIETNTYQPESLIPYMIVAPATVYAWPYAYQREVSEAIAGPAVVYGVRGPMAQGDLDPLPYPFYYQHTVDETFDLPVLANFEHGIQLRDLQLTLKADNKLQVDLFWSSEDELDQSLNSFVHVLDFDQIIGQSDSIPGQGTWPTYFWRPGLLIGDGHMIELSKEFDKNRHRVIVGMYEANSGDRLSVLDAGGKPVSDFWLLEP